ncbi:MAG: hypothetical protein AB8B65_17325 [Kordia sp.]|uniref:hypothetical protein n=1 Tax=Kordia sp. TaxID=1965332 RepID=UPI00385DF3CD
MKKTILLASILVSFFMTSCGNSIKSDVAKLTDMQCQMMKLKDKAMAGEKSAEEELKKLDEKIIAFSKELKEKHSSDAQKKEFQEALDKAVKEKGCASTFDTEVNQIAEMQCQGIKLSKKAMAGDKDAQAELKELGEKMMALGKDLKEKYYPTKEQKKKFQEALDKVMKAKGCEY